VRIWLVFAALAAVHMVFCCTVGASAGAVYRGLVEKLSIGVPQSQVLAWGGEPVLRVPTPHGYEWLVYSGTEGEYVQVAAANGRVVGFYTKMEGFSYAGVAVGDTAAGARNPTLMERVSVQYAGASVEIAPADGTADWIYLYAQEGGSVPTLVHFFIDRMDGSRITAIMVMELPKALASGYHSYEMQWRGQRPSLESEPITGQKQTRADQAAARQLFYLANASRSRHGLEPLRWDETAAAAARAHSQDMVAHGFFSHKSETRGQPWDRADEAGLEYATLGENIAMGSADAITAHHGWMNSPGHRSSILSRRFDAMGAGSAESTAFTQVFLESLP